MFSHLFGALGSLGSLSAIGFLVLGAVIGVIVGVVPGLSSAVVLSLILVFVYHLDLTATLCLFLGAHAGSYYSASITAILLNTPAHPEAYAVTFDGYPMARNGQAGRALGLSAVSTCIGGIVGCIVLVAFTPLMSILPNMFHPPEYLAVITLALVLVAALGTSSPGRALASIGLGLMVASIGSSSITGESRFTYNNPHLLQGIELVGLALGVFAIAQMVLVFGTGTSGSNLDLSGRELANTTAIELGNNQGRQLLGGIREGAVGHFPLTVQSGVIGALSGLVPGMGGFVANFISYAAARQVSRQRDKYGTGIAQGIIAPEGASLAKEAGGMIPVLGLGIAGGVGGALFLAALEIQGITTGYDVQRDYPTLTYEVAWIVALTGIIGTGIGVLSGRFLAQSVKIKGPLLVPFIFSLAVVGAFVTAVDYAAVIEVLIFGVIGLVLRRLGYSLATFILGLVLGPTFENNFYLTHNLYPGVSFLSARPASAVIFAVAVLVLIARAAETRRSRGRRAAGISPETGTGLRAEIARAEATRGSALTRALALRSNYPILNFITSLVLLSLSIYWVLYASSTYSFAGALMPVVGGLAVLVATAAGLGTDLYHVLRYVRLRLRNRNDPAAAPPAAEGGALADALPPGSAPAGGQSAVLPGGEATAADGSSLLAAVATATPEAPAKDEKPIILKSWRWNGQYSRELAAFGWLVALITLCYVFGFEVAVPVWVFAYGIVCTRRFLKTRRSRVIFIVASTVSMWAVTYLMFTLTNPLFTPLIAK